MIEIAERSAAGLSYLACDGGNTLPVVLLHGIGSNAQSFVPLMRAFEGRYPVIAWNAPGYGKSPPLAASWPDASDYATALNRLLARLGILRCVLAGHSLGALMAARFTLAAPRRVAALVLVSPALGYGVAKGGVLPPAVAQRIEELDRLGAKRFASERAPGLLAEPVERTDVLHAVARSMSEVQRPGYDQAARLLAGGTLLDDAARLEVATAVVVGAQDRITPPASARRLFDALPQAGRFFHEVAAAGHAVCQEQPQDVAHIIAELVEREARAHA